MRLIDADAIPYELWTTEVEVDKTRDNGTYHYFQNRFMVDRRTIAAMPTIEERSKGKWIEYTDCEGKSRKITCNQCGHEVWSWFNLNYCPHCGADMRGDEK